MTQTTALLDDLPDFSSMLRTLAVRVAGVPASIDFGGHGRCGAG